MTRGDTTNSQGRQVSTAPEKKRVMTRGGGATRGVQVEAPLDKRQWRDKKLRQWRTRGSTITSWGMQEA
jgi:hypothetical protein